MSWRERSTHSRASPRTSLTVSLPSVTGTIDTHTLHGDSGGVDLALVLSRLSAFDIASCSLFLSGSNHEQARFSIGALTFHSLRADEGRVGPRWKGWSGWRGGHACYKCSRIDLNDQT